MWLNLASKIKFVNKQTSYCRFILKIPTGSGLSARHVGLDAGRPRCLSPVSSVDLHTLISVRLGSERGGWRVFQELRKQPQTANLPN